MHHSVEFLPDTISFWLPGHKADQTKARGFFATGAYIMQRKTPLALYKGLGAVLSGIVPKMATCFASFEAYKSWLMDKETRQISVGNIFIGIFTSVLLYMFLKITSLQSRSAGLGAGTMEVVVVMPMEVVKI